MKTKLIASLSVATATLATLFSAQTLAYCDFHDDSMFGQFSRQHQIMRQPIFVRQPSLVLRHEIAVTVNKKEQSVLNINYRLPESFSNVALAFTASEGVELKALEPVVLTEAKGQYSIDYKAKDQGDFDIVITATALNNGEPYTKTRTVSVTAI